MIKKELIDYKDVEEYSEIVAHNKDHFGDDTYRLYVNGASYSRTDLLVTYKIIKLLKWKFITKEKYKYLMNLYREKLILEDKIYSHHNNDEETYEKLERIEHELEEYHLLPEYLEIDNLIYDSVKNQKVPVLKRTKQKINKQTNQS